MSNYVSPYGYGPAIDALLDVVAERQDITTNDLIVDLDNNPSARDWIDEFFWDQYGGPAVDALENLLYPQDPS